jgi:hypothetical protein
LVGVLEGTRVPVGVLVGVRVARGVCVEVAVDVPTGAIAALAEVTDPWRPIATVAHAIVEKIAITTGRAETLTSLPS